MSTEKRDRQRANRAQRVADAEELLQRRKRRSRLITYAIVAVVIIGGVLVVATLTSDDDPDTSADLGDSPSAADTSDSVAGDATADVAPDYPTANEDTAEGGTEPASRERAPCRERRQSQARPFRRS